LFNLRKVTAILVPQENVPKKNLLISEIKKAGFKAAETHIRPNSIRSSITIKGLVKIIKKLN